MVRHSNFSSTGILITLNTLTSNQQFFHTRILPLLPYHLWKVCSWFSKALANTALKEIQFDLNTAQMEWDKIQKPYCDFLWKACKNLSYSSAENSLGFKSTAHTSKGQSIEGHMVRCNGRQVWCGTHYSISWSKESIGWQLPL